MLTRADFDQFRLARILLSRQAAVLPLRHVPYQAMHKTLVLLAWLETWARIPLRTRHLLREVDDTFQSLADIDVDRSLVARLKTYQLYLMQADIGTLLLYLHSPKFRARALRWTNRDALDLARSAGGGVIIVGFRIGSYGALPWALATSGYQVHMIAGGEYSGLARAITRIYVAPRERQVTWCNADDPLVLSRCVTVLRGGGVVCTLLDILGGRGKRRLETTLLSREVHMPYGILALASMTGSTLLPAIMTRDSGPSFTLRVGAPLKCARGRGSPAALLAELCSQLENWITGYGDQWVGWPALAAGGHQDARSGDL